MRSIKTPNWRPVCLGPKVSQITKFIGPIWGPPGSCRPQIGPMLAPWTFLSGVYSQQRRMWVGDRFIPKLCPKSWFMCASNIFRWIFQMPHQSCCASPAVEASLFCLSKQRRNISWQNKWSNVRAHACIYEFVTLQRFLEFLWFIAFTNITYIMINSMIHSVAMK